MKENEKSDQTNLGGVPVYLDCNATSPVDREVADAVYTYMVREFGNAGSRTHEFGARSKRAVQRARDQVAAVVNAGRDEVLFTSGATESNNLAILGLAEHAKKSGCKHIVSTEIEHKAVLEPLRELQQRDGFEVTLVPPTEGGWVDAEAVLDAVRTDTVLVSVMHVNNETGVIQPVEGIASGLENHEAYFHVDAAQSFGKLSLPLQNKRIDLISISAHKVYGPKGVGALVARRRGYRRPPLRPLTFGGGQERGLRPGTVPVPLVVGLGLAAELAIRDEATRRESCMETGRALLDGLRPLSPIINGDMSRTLHNTVNVRIPGVDSEAVIIALKDIAAVSNGSACTSADYRPSHVLLAMGLDEAATQEAVRFSWSHLTGIPPVDEIRSALESLR